MGKFTKDERVIFKEGRELHRGKITEVMSECKKCRIVTDSGKRFVVPVRRLRQSPDRVLILETRLDRSLKSRRIYGEMMQKWLSAYRVEALYERVHTIEDLRRFLLREGKNVATRFVHIMGHGSDETGVGGAMLHLTFESMDLLEDANVFQGLRGKILIFSCCDVGGDRRVMETIKEKSGAAAIIAYRKTVEDSYTNLCEVLLYDRLLRTIWSPQKVVESVGRALGDLGVRVEDHITRRPVLVCYA